MPLGLSDFEREKFKHDVFDTPNDFCLLSDLLLAVRNSHLSAYGLHIYLGEGGIHMMYDERCSPLFITVADH